MDIVCLDLDEASQRTVDREGRNEIRRRAASWRPHSLSIDCSRFVRADWVIKRASAAFVMLRFSYNTFKIFQSMFFIEVPS